MPYTERDDETVKAEIESGKPAIEPGQLWSRYEIGDGPNTGLARLERQLLVIGRHPIYQDQIICEDVGNTIYNGRVGNQVVHSIPELNLRKLFRPDGDWKVDHG